PYSPDLNKIERWWFVLKNWMRQRWDEFETFRDCVDAAFRDSPNVLRSGYTVQPQRNLRGDIPGS
ncbi:MULTISPECIES: transposase, partial [unclassified Leptolyngbya]